VNPQRRNCRPLAAAKSHHNGRPTLNAPLQSLWKLEAQKVALGGRWAILTLQGHLRPDLESHRLHPRRRARLPAQIGLIPDQAFCSRGQDPGRDGMYVLDWELREHWDAFFGEVRG